MNRRRGFSLSEVLMGMLVLVSMFFALASIFPSSLASLRKSQNNLGASNVARQTIEDWQNRPFQSLQDATGPQVSTVTEDGITYSVVVTVSDLDPPWTADPQNAKVIDVQVLSRDDAETGQAEERTCVFNYSNPM